jgi:hypothetical protein
MRGFCVDGTAACFKTTILEQLREQGYQVQKINKVSTSSNINTLGVAAMGYITRGIRLLNSSVVTFLDRSPLNPLQWHVLWSLFDLYVKTFKNVRPSEIKHTEDWKIFEGEFRERFQMLQNSVWYKDFNNHIQGIAIIDSNTEYVRTRMSRRNRSSDTERSQWMFYPELQNLMYQILYTKCFDIADYDEPLTFQNAVVQYLKDVAEELKTAETTFFPTTYHLPVHSLDLPWLNLHSHVYRTLGKAHVKQIELPSHLMPMNWSYNWNEDGERKEIINAPMIVPEEIHYEEVGMEEGEAFDDI